MITKKHTLSNILNPLRVKLLKPLKDKGYDRCVLYHHMTGQHAGEEEQPIEDEPAASEGMVNETTYGVDKSCEDETASSAPSASLIIVMLPDGESDDMHSFANKN